MKTRVVALLIAAIGVFTVGTANVDAGGAQGAPQFLNNFFVCHGINGAPQDAVVDIYTDELGTSPLKDVRIGNGVIGCSQVRVVPQGGTLEQEIIPTAGLYLKCYTMTTSRSQTGPQAGLPPAFSAIDSVDPDAETVTTGGTRYLCGPATFTLQP